MHDFFAKIDPQLSDAFPADAPNLLQMMQADIPAVRAFFNEYRKHLETLAPPFHGTKEEYNIAGLEGEPEVRVIEFAQRDMLYPDCIIIWLHGGGYIIGDADDLVAQSFASLCPVISVDYRMAPEHRSPAAAHDVCGVIEYVARHINPRKIALAGASAGGGLAASSALLNRDRNGSPLDFQLLFYPMLDDQHDTASGQMDIPPSIWNRDVSLFAWSLYAEEKGASPYAAALRADDVSGLPPTYIMCGDMDLFLDENKIFAERLSDAGVATELAIFPNAPHGFNGFAPKANVSKRANASIRLAMEHALARA